jgi:hypothetical protein
MIVVNGYVYPAARLRGSLALKLVGKEPEKALRALLLHCSSFCFFLGPKMPLYVPHVIHFMGFAPLGFYRLFVFFNLLFHLYLFLSFPFGSRYSEAFSSWCTMT